MKLGPYLVERELGRGGMGVVYRAVGPDGAPVALKVLTAATSLEALDRFARERRLLSTLGPAEGFVPLLDAGEHERRPYVVMALLEGGTLRDRLERGRLAVAEAVTLGVRLARALGHAHAKGIVHRDVKPENVLFDAHSRAFLADLGLAKHFKHDVDGASLSFAVSRSDGLKGTPGYMAPEQATAGAVGPAADVFALGAVLHECLAGEPAFHGENLVELLDALLNRTVKPLAKTRADAPAWLVAIIERSLSSEPSRRFEDGAALAAALEAGARGVRSRRSAKALALGAASVLVAVGAGALLLRPTRASVPASPPVAAVVTRIAPSPPSPAPALPAPPPPSPPTKTEEPRLDLPRRWALAAGAPLSWIHDRTDEVFGGRPVTPEALAGDAKDLATTWRVETRLQLLQQLHWLRDKGDSAAYFETLRLVEDDPERARALIEATPVPRHASLERNLLVLDHRVEIGRRGLAAWDLSRLINIAGRGANLGLLTEEEAWAWIGQAAKRLQASYGSWRELATHISLGRRFWRHDSVRKGAVETVERMLVDPRSPWLRYEWRTDLDAGAPWPHAPR